MENSDRADMIGQIRTSKTYPYSIHKIPDSIPGIPGLIPKAPLTISNLDVIQVVLSVVAIYTTTYIERCILQQSTMQNDIFCTDFAV